MAFNDRLVAGAASSAPVLNGVTSGNRAAGSTMLMAQVAVDTLSATVALTAATATITLTPFWQVSDDASTWVDVYGVNNAAYVVQTTGTAAIVTRVLEAPRAVYGKRYSRVTIQVGVVTGGASDLASVSYSYVVSEGF